MSEEIEVSNLRCRNCRFFNCRADMKGVESTCKRLDHKTIRFAVPWFKSYDCDFGTICSNFEPRDGQTAIKKEWEDLGGFSGWFPLWIEQWRGGKTDGLLYFTLGEDTNVRYGVKFLDYVYGKMIIDGELQAVEKMYYRKHRICKEYPTGYELVHEVIGDG